MNSLLLRCCVLGILLTAFAAPAVAADPAEAPVLLVPARSTSLNVAVDLPPGLAGADSALWDLVEQGTDLVVPADVVPAWQTDGSLGQGRFRLLATIPPRKGASGQRRFLLKKKVGAYQLPQPAFEWRETSPASLELRQENRPVLVYNHGPITNEKVPQKDQRRTRGCYLHPIYGLDGEVLTDDFPRDHYHHHGLFWAWPHVKIDGKEYDLWMGKGIQQRLVRKLGQHVGRDSAVLGVENGWFVGDRKVMIERVWITAHESNDQAQAVDVDLTLIPVDRPVTLWGAEGKSYGGMTIRFAIPRKKKGEITVPSGKTRRDLSIKRLAWTDLTYPFDGKNPSGAALMISKSHPDYPPTWLTRHYGPQCVGYPGVEPKTFEPGKPITMRYRLWIHKGAVEPDVLRTAYDAYTTGEQLQWETPAAGQ